MQPDNNIAPKLAMKSHPSLLSIPKYFFKFRNYLGRKIYLLLLLIISSSYLEGFGISMLLPLLNFESGQPAQNKFSELIYELFHVLGIHISFTSLLSLIIIVFTLKTVLLFAQQVMQSYILTYLSERFRKMITTEYSNMKYMFYSNTEIGFFNNVITTESLNAISTIKIFLFVLVSLMSSTAYFFFSLAINYQLTIAIIILGIITQVSYRGLRKKVTKISLKIPASNALIQNLIIQYIHNFKYFKTVSGRFDFNNKLIKEIKNNRILNFKNNLLNITTASSFELIKIISLSIIIFFLVKIKNQEITIILVPIFLLNRFLGEILNFQNKWQSFCSNIGGFTAFEQAKNILAENKEDISGSSVSYMREEIVLRDLNFSFGTNRTLSHIDMEIHLNECVGIAGESGAGKSTLIDIITGLLPQGSGSITLDGKEYRDLAKKDLRSLFGYITQEPIIFNDTISNNISLWNDSLENFEKIEQAAKMAHCTEFIQELKDGFETIVGDKGIKLSGGQRQRISIAREIYRNSDILIFDEATSALDSKSENLIQQSINGLLGEKTLIIVAHRLSTLRHCDQIYVLQQGEIIEKGSWDTLLNNPESTFAQMCKMQGIYS